MNGDLRLYRRSTLLSLHEDDEVWQEVIDGLEYKDHTAGPDGRFQFVPSGAGIPLMLPSCSFFNRATDEPWYIYTNGMADEGAVYIGKSDFDSLAATAGYVPVQHVEHVSEEKMRLEHDLAIAVAAVRDLRSVIASMASTTSLAGDAVTSEKRKPVPPVLEPARSGKVGKRDTEALIDDLGLGD